MSDDKTPNLPVKAACAGELLVSVTQEGLLVDGSPEAVDGFIDKIKAAAGHVVDTANISKGAVGNLAGVAVGLPRRRAV